MASTDTRPAPPRAEVLTGLTPEDLGMLERLVVESHWNQVAADWRFFSRQGRVLVLRDTQARIVASGAVLPMDADDSGQQVCWISMILVLPETRGQGLGRQVFEACLAHALAAGYLPMLDATPQGEPLYTQFGFKPFSHITRWRREAHAEQAQDPSSPQLQPADLPALDRQALGFGRRALLADLQGRVGSSLLRQPGGFALIRAGRTAHHIGPVLAEDESTGLELLRQAFDAVAAPLLIDAPRHRPTLDATLLAAGFTPQRDFARMAFVPTGRTLPQGQAHFIHAIAGPEFA